MVRENHPVLTLGAQYAAEIPEMQDIPCALLEPLPEPLFSARTLYPSEGYHLFAFATLNSSFKTEFITLDSNSRAQYEQQPLSLGKVNTSSSVIRMHLHRYLRRLTLRSSKKTPVTNWRHLASASTPRSQMDTLLLDFVTQSKPVHARLKVIMGSGIRNRSLIHLTNLFTLYLCRHVVQLMD